MNNGLRITGYNSHTRKHDEKMLQEKRRYMENHLYGTSYGGDGR